MSDEKKVRHVLGISGGKDSTALAIYMRDKVPNIEYFFCDTGKELPETYDYLAQLEKYLGKNIIRLNPDRTFDFWLDMNGNYLPSSQMRWCTINLKLKPLEKFLENDQAVNYVGIRADEAHRKGLEQKDHIKSVFPFIEDGIDKAGVFKIIKEAGLGLPKYYEWRTRSGCYFCFFQRKIEWVGLLERHPELFEKAKAYEKFDPVSGKRFTWNQSESLEELSRPERIAEIKAMHAKRVEKEKTQSAVNKPLHEVLEEVLEGENINLSCNICHL